MRDAAQVTGKDAEVIALSSTSRRLKRYARIFACYAIVLVPTYSICAVIEGALHRFWPVDAHNIADQGSAFLLTAGALLLVPSLFAVPLFDLGVQRLRLGRTRVQFLAAAILGLVAVAASLIAASCIVILAGSNVRITSGLGTLLSFPLSFVIATSAFGIAALNRLRPYML